MQSELELYFTLQKQQAAGEQGEEEQQQLTATDADNNEYIVNINALPNWVNFCWIIKLFLSNY